MSVNGLGEGLRGFTTPDLGIAPVIQMINAPMLRAIDGAHRAAVAPLTEMISLPNDIVQRIIGTHDAMLREVVKSLDVERMLGDVWASIGAQSVIARQLNLMMTPASLAAIRGLTDLQTSMLASLTQNVIGSVQAAPLKDGADLSALFNESRAQVAPEPRVQDGSMVRGTTDSRGGVSFSHTPRLVERSDQLRRGLERFKGRAMVWITLASSIMTIHLYAEEMGPRVVSWMEAGSEAVESVIDQFETPSPDE